MKTTGMPHQLEALRRCNGRKGFGLFMEMGTGKTWTLLADAERMYSAGVIDAMLVIAPKGVHTNWVRREIPEHVSVPYVAAAYLSGGGKKNKQEVAKVFAPRQNGDVPPLRILTINIDAINANEGYDVARSFLNCTRAMLVVDESDRIKNPASARTKRVMKLAPYSRMRRVASGLPILQGPMDVFAQMEFLESGLLGTTSYRAFVAEYAELLPQNHGLMKHIADRAARGMPLPQVIARNPDGSPKYKNLERLQQLLSPHSYRVLKKECLDLPDKIYKQLNFELTAQQRRAYERIEDELRINLDDQIVTVKQISALGKLRQVTSGFVIVDGEPRLVPADTNPRMDLLLALLNDLPPKVIIWAHYREELAQIAAALVERGKKVVEYHGGVSAKDRETAVDQFQNGDAEYWVGQPQSGGIGLTLTAAEHVVYYSNDFSLGVRKQSEDRCHRIGTKNSVLYFDLVASATIDEPIARALQRKEAVAKEILGDKKFPLPLN